MNTSFSRKCIAHDLKLVKAGHYNVKMHLKDVAINQSHKLQSKKENDVMSRVIC